MPIPCELRVLLSQLHLSAVDEDLSTHGVFVEYGLAVGAEADSWMLIEWIVFSPQKEFRQ